MAYRTEHPRDLFDVHHLLLNEGFSDEIRLGFITCLISHPRPIHEMIRPTLPDQKQVFETQFTGLTLEPFSYEDYETARTRLTQEVHQLLTDGDREFLISLKSGTPDWSLLPLERLSELPAVKWKLANIEKLKRENPNKHKEQRQKLEHTLSGN